MSPNLAKLSYTVNEVCAVTGLSRSTVYNLVQSGSLRKIKVRGRTLFSAADVRALVTGGEQ